MAYDEVLDKELAFLTDRLGLQRKRMFGGTGYLINGNMVCGVYERYLIVRVGPDAGKRLVNPPDVRLFDLTGRPMNGWLMVSQEVLGQGEMERWVQTALNYAETLPPKNK